MPSVSFQTKCSSVRWCLLKKPHFPQCIWRQFLEGRRCVFAEKCMFPKQTAALQRALPRLFLEMTIFLKRVMLCVGRSTVQGKGLACWALGSFPESAAERLHDLGTSDDLHGSYHLHVIWFPPSVRWGNAHIFLILFSVSSIDVLELVTVWKWDLSS